MLDTCTGTTLQISGVVLLYVSVVETWGGVSHTAGPAHTYTHTGGFTLAECQLSCTCVGGTFIIHFRGVAIY